MDDAEETFGVGTKYSLRPADDFDGKGMYNLSPPFAELRVRPTGWLVCEAHLPHISAPFEPTTLSYGTPLALSLVKHMTAQLPTFTRHGGHCETIPYTFPFSHHPVSSISGRLVSARIHPVHRTVSLHIKQDPDERPDL